MISVEHLDYQELIKKADGTLGDAYLDRVDIVRLNPDFSEELIKLNLKLALDGDVNNDIELKSMDRIRVYSMSEMVPKSLLK